jgi:hypothetical protein
MCSYIALKILRNKQTNKTKTTNKQTNRDKNTKKLGKTFWCIFLFSFSVMIIVLAWDDNDMLFFFILRENIV